MSEAMKESDQVKAILESPEGALTSRARLFVSLAAANQYIAELEAKNTDLEREPVKAELIAENRALQERVRELEAENSRLKKKCERLACDVVIAAQDYSAPMSDCRLCDYDRFCKRKLGQIKPN